MGTSFTLPPDSSDAASAARNAQERNGQERAATKRVTGDPDDAETDSIDNRIAVLLSQVGDGVRSARKALRMSRRELSEKSGVSQRYLAQLEVGQGNISIGLLLRITEALDIGLPQLLEANHGRDADPDLARIQALLASASDDTRQEVLDLLSRDTGRSARKQRVALIGLRGAGKSTIGRLAGERLDVPFVELNNEIEVASGLPVQDVIGLYDHDGYRTLEFQALRCVADQNERVILAVAGGIVAQEDAYRFLLANFHSIWLQAAPEDHIARVRGQGDERPMAGSPDALGELHTILDARKPLYARASATVDTSAGTLNEAVARVVSVVRSRGFLDRGAEETGA